MKHRGFSAAIILAFATPLCTAGEVRQERENATLEVRFEGPALRLALADLVTATLTIEGPPGFLVRAPREFPGDFPWTLVSMSAPERSSRGDGKEHWRIVYQLGPRAPGKKAALKFPDVQVREADGAGERVITWAPIHFDIETAIAEPTREALRDITSIEELPPAPTPEQFPWPWAAAAVAVVAALVLLLSARRWWRIRRLRTPAQRALYEWERLMALRLPEQERGERFFTLLTLIVRAYLEQAHGLAARRQTTPEFLKRLAAEKRLTSEQKQFLAAFFEHAETAKFAPAQVAIEQCHEWAQRVRAFLLNG